MQLLPTSPAALLTFYFTINQNSFGFCPLALRLGASELHVSMLKVVSKH